MPGGSWNSISAVVPPATVVRLISSSPLPPAAAAIVAGLIWNGELIQQYLPMPVLQKVALVTTLFAGLLMVSNVRYHSFKGINWRSKVPFATILMIVLALVFVSAAPEQLLFAIFFIYALSGPVYTLILLRRRRAERASLKRQGKSD